MLNIFLEKTQISKFLMLQKQKKTSQQKVGEPAILNYLQHNDDYSYCQHIFVLIDTFSLIPSF